MITVHCPTCPKVDKFKNQDEARKRGWRGMGWKRPMKHRQNGTGATGYWGQCPTCKAAEETETDLESFAAAVAANHQQEEDKPCAITQPMPQIQSKQQETDTDASENFSPTLDPGISGAVGVLRAAGVETFESCDGSPGHSFPEPTIRFHGDRSEGFRALAAALQAKLPVTALRRAWPVLDCEPTGPYWEMAFTRKP